MKNEKQNWTPAVGHIAICRNLTGGDLRAAILLYRFCGLWTAQKKKLERHNKEWLAASSVDWAKAAGLTESEMKNYAVPRLKKACSTFLEIRTMRIAFGKPNMLWISLDWEAMQQAIVPLDMWEMMPNSPGLPPEKKAYLFKNGEAVSGAF